MRTANSVARTVVITLALVGVALAPRVASAHCDTLGGPVVTTAKQALEKGDVTPVLKWVKPAQEAEIRAAFGRTLAVRKLGPEAKEMADMYFFETLVRIHREGEGAPYTGLKPAGAVEPAVSMADQALETGNVDHLASAISTHVVAGIKERFARAFKAKKLADDSVAAGREFVEAYVQFTHYVERLHLDATTSVEHHGEGASEEQAGHGHE
jgi:hypothetical protein